MVDEFQDASQARARMTRALVSAPGRYLLAVGDDWQAINRFAGSDLSVLTGFHDYFGAGQSLYLTTTFRCHQSISDIAPAFVSKNPAQLAKTVRSLHTQPARASAHEGVQLRQVSKPGQVANTIASFLDELEAGIATGAVPRRDGRMVTVDVLGRYRFDQQLMPTRTPRHVRLTFRTVHSAKGLEADYIIVPNLAAGTYGFPSQIGDDPVLSHAMVEADRYPHAEERRLLYVSRHGP